ncbi:DUF3631 domain-containing protein [Hyphococcus sp.]|uniref:DUF3631 domain-containing protein n=1 Tax=Hyphococcus sp. TaxID=2038636 RepID=UPI003CCB813D
MSKPVTDPFDDDRDYLAPEIDSPARLLDDVSSFISRFCAFPDEHCLVAVTLWAAHTHMSEHFHTTPRLAMLSPEPGSGKTRVLEVLDLTVRRSLFCLNASPAAIFRTLSKEPVTILADECDAIFSKRGKEDSNEELRAVFNAGYKRGAKIPRCVGPKHDVEYFDVFAPVALAGLGDLPDTIMSRAVIIRMRRRNRFEKVEPFRNREHGPEGETLRDELETWGKEVGEQVGASWPELPSGIEDRPAEIWEPLIAVADAAGGDWPELARNACLALSKVALDRKVSLGVRLLGDMRTVFGDAIALHTKTIIERLCNPEKYGLAADAPWAELHGKPITTRTLAGMLKKYGVESKKVKVEGVSLQGYRREPLHDAWERYLSPSPMETEPMELTEPGSMGSGGSA